MLYIVIDADQHPTTLHKPGYPDGPKAGLLLCPNWRGPLTAFRSRSAARAAMRRTAKYAKARMLPWACRKWKAKRVETV